jgi:neutral amino acid transport system permease protein
LSDFRRHWKKETLVLDAMVSQLGNGIVLGAVIALTAVGLSLIFGVTGIVNFAHGDLVTLGATIALVFSLPPDTVPGGQDISMWIAVPLTVVVGFAVGALLELMLMRPLRSRRVGTVTMLVVTIGLGFIIRYLVFIWIGGKPYTYPVPIEIQGSYFGFIDMTAIEFRLVALTILILAGVGIFLTKTRLGTAMRAISDNEDLAESSGIDSNTIYVATWSLGIALAFAGGILQGIVTNVTWTMGFFLLLLMFAAVIVGGIGNPFGAMVGGFIIGLLIPLSTALPVISDHPDLRFAVALFVMIVVLLVRPQGILGSKERVS